MLAAWTADKWGPLPWVWWAVIGLLLVAGLLGLANGALNRVYRPVDGLVQGVVGRMGSGKSLLIVMRILLPYCKGLGKRGYVTSDSFRPMVRAVTNFRFDPGMSGVEVRTVAPNPETGVSIFGALIALAHELGAVEGPWYDSKGRLQDGRDGRTGRIRPMPDIEPHEVPGEPGKWAYVRQPIINGVVVLDEMHLFANSSKLALGDEASWLISMARKLNMEMWWASQHEMKIHKRLRDESSSLWLAAKLSGIAAFMIGGGWHVAREYHSPALVERARNSLGTSSAPKSSDRRIYRFTKKSKQFYNSFELLIPDAPTRRGAGAVAARRGAGDLPPSTGDEMTDAAVGVAVAKGDTFSVLAESLYPETVDEVT